MRNDPTPSPFHDLSPDQKHSVKELEQSIWRFVDQFESLSQEERHGVFGIFGGRGAGKSTLLETVCGRLSEDTSLKEKLRCLSPLDLTTVSHQVPLGLSILEHCLRELGWSPTTAGKSSAAFKEGLEKIQSLYFSMDPHYRELWLSLAVTSAEYRELAVRETVARGQIAEAVGHLLDAIYPQRRSEAREGGQLAAESARPPFPLLLLPLEDVDLAIRLLTADFFNIFLDQLCRQGLLFILVGDEEHLEAHLARGLEKEHSPTIIKLLAKLVPETHRTYLSPWRLRDVLAFVPFQERKAITLRQRLAECLEQLSPGLDHLLPRDLYAILPRYPRGLNDFHQKLTALLQKKDQGQEISRLEAEDEVVFTIARCRGDHRLARSLKALSLEGWAGRFHWPEEGDAPAFWSRLLFDVRNEGALLGLGPSEFPARGLDSGDTAAWTETLLNISFRRRPNSVGLFIRRFAPVRERTAQAAIDYAPGLHELTQLVLRSPASLESPWFLWSGDTGPQARLEAGWGSLVAGVLGTQASKLPQILRDMGLNESSPSQQSQVEPGILPLDVRSLLRLTDQITELPWVPLADWVRSHPLTEWPALLALLVGRAYLLALEEALQQEEEEPKGRSRDLADRIGGLEFALLAKLSPAERLVRLDDLVAAVEAADLPVDHPATRATLAFFRSAAAKGIPRPDPR